MCKNRSRGIESAYGAILIAILISIFIGIYTTLFSYQEKSYNDIMLSLERERLRDSEKLILTKINSDLMISSTVDSRIIMFLARNSVESYYLNVSQNPIIVPANKYVKIPDNVSDWIRDKWSRRLRLYAITDLGNMIDLSSYLALIYNDANITEITSGGCFYYDFVFEACKNCYYIVLGTWKAYTPSQSPPLTFYEIPVYAWDINQSYTILKSPVDGLVYLRKISDQPPTQFSYPILETRNWFNIPWILYHPNPFDMRVKFDAYISDPWNLYNTTALGGGRTNIYYSYNGSVVISIDAYWIYPTGLTIYYTTKDYVSVNKFYNFTLFVHDNYLWNLTFEYRVLVNTYRVGGLYYDRLALNTRRNPDSGDLYGDLVGVIYPNPRVVLVSEVLKSVNFSFYTNNDLSDNVYLGKSWDNVISLTIYINPSQIVASNTSIYRPDSSGYITASNGYKIKEIVTKIYFSDHASLIREILNRYNSLDLSFNGFSLLKIDHDNKIVYTQNISMIQFTRSREKLI